MNMFTIPSSDSNTPKPVTKPQSKTHLTDASISSTHTVAHDKKATPAPFSAHTPAHAPAHAPVPAPVHAPVHAPAHAPAPAPVHAAASAPV